MIRKINAILLSLLLLVPTFGVSVEKHFCGGRLADVALFTGAGCSCDGETENNSCCHEEEQVLRMDLGQFSSSVQRVPMIAQQDVLTYLGVIETLLGESSAVSTLYFYDLPPPEAVPFYRMNCSFTFYG
jgi:hypothetical protein